MKLREAIVLGICLLPLPAFAAETPAANPALSPQESLEQIEVDPGLKVELVANEPNVIDPVAIRFDEDGRMWVVEMRDYPTGPTKEFPARSRISVLRDKDGDGYYETATVFADDLAFATGVQPWRGGVFVTLAGKVAYMKDTDGDDRADANETWYTGFAQVNEQLRANHPTLALDGRIYIAAGLRGGTISDPSHPEIRPVSISGRDFRFDPLTRKFESVTGDGQFGLTFNDFGDRFVCSNRDPAIHVVLQEEQLRKNPLVAVDSVVNHVVPGQDITPVHPIGRAWTTSNLHAGHFTAACAVFIYRGDAIPSLRGNIFACEPTGYLVHREVIEASGVSFKVKPQNQTKEFFASRDEWCRPVNLETGPDGALYVVDMYRQIIEHPEWMPEELRHRPNLCAGNDRGRIYRVVPVDFKRRAAPKLSKLASTKLVDELADPNSWHRETAFRVLLERQDKFVADKLRTTALDNKSQATRILALRLLAGLSELDEPTIAKLLTDADPRIVEQAIIVADAHVKRAAGLRKQIGELATNNDARVRFQSLIVASPQLSSPEYPIDHWEEDAILIAAGNHAGEALQHMLRDPKSLQSNLVDAQKFIFRLARLAAANKDNRQFEIGLQAIGSEQIRKPIESSQDNFARIALTGFLTEFTRDGLSASDLIVKLDGVTRHNIGEIMLAARTQAFDVKAPIEDRVTAIDLFALTTNNPRYLFGIAGHDSNLELRLRAIAALTKRKAVGLLLEILIVARNESPTIQRALLDGLLSSSDGTKLLLNSIADGEIRPTMVDPVHAKLILASKDEQIRARAKELLSAAAPADRQKALAEYKPALELKADAVHGRAVFEKRCSMCHRISNVGTQFAPDISDSRERTPLQLLTDILQPNRAIDSNYFSYTAITNDGRIHTGVLGAETSTSVTLKQQEGKSETLRRDEIDELHSDGVSFMPEGLEKDIPPQDMADLISFIKNWRYLENPQDFSPTKK
jgi:putative membrane-bound dehydrogenase-like protein